MYGFIYTNSPPNTAYQLLLLGSKIDGGDSVVEEVIDVRHLFPRWILDRNSNGNMVKFVQAYYDWLYNKGDYQLSTTTFNSSGLRRLIDLDETPVEYLKHFAYSYVPDFPDRLFNLSEENEEGESIDRGPFIRDFIKGIRNNFYQKKSTEEAYEYFFQTLYGIDTPPEFYYPKKNILRLNGGRFSDWMPKAADNPIANDPQGGTYDYSNENADTQNLGGSYLNGPHYIQDSYWYQNFSYVVKAGVGDELLDSDTGLPLYYEEMNSILHPAGIKGFFEKTSDDYIPPDDHEGGWQTCEIPKLGNYFPYRLKDGPGDISPCIGCSGGGFTYAGLTGMASNIIPSELSQGNGFTYGDGWAIAGDGSISADFNMPTFVYPHWADGITGDPTNRTPFQNIYIGDFLYLCPLENSPNLGITGCTAYGTAPEGQECWR